MITNKELREKGTIKFSLVVGLFLIVLGFIVANGWADSLFLSVISLYKGEPPAPHWPDKLHTIGTEFLFSIVIAVTLGWLALRKWSQVVSLLQKNSFLIAASTFVVVALWLPVILAGHSTIIAGERFWWLGDDAMISMRYGRNLATGVGLVWNVGESVEGYTNFLWTIYMGLVHLFPIPDSKTSLVVLLTNIVFTIATIPVIIRLVRALGGSTITVVFTLLGYVLSKSMMVWTTEGFETSLLTFLFLLSIYRVIKESHMNRPRLLTFALIATISLVRADAMVLSVLLYTLSVLLNKNRKLVVFYSVVSLILPIAHEIFRISYYGDVLPNTAYLKALNWKLIYVAGLGYVLDFAKHYPIIIVIAVVGSLLSKQRVRVYLLAILFLYMAYVAYIGGDAFQNFRFFVPVLPLLLTLAFLGIKSLKFTLLSRYFRNIFKQQFVQKATRIALLVGGITIVALSLVADLLGAGTQPGFGIKQFFGLILGLGLLTVSLSYLRCQKILHHVQQRISFSLALSILCLISTPLIVPGYSSFLHPGIDDIDNIRIGLLLKKNTPRTSRVADFWAGSVFYFSDRYAIDLLGKSDRYIAHLPETSNGTKSGHNKFDFDYSLGMLKPDFVVAMFKLPVEIELMKKLATGDWAFIGQLYFNSVFREHYLPNPVFTETKRTIFVYDLSTQMRKKEIWKELSVDSK